MCDPEASPLKKINKLSFKNPQTYKFETGNAQQVYSAELKPVMDQKQIREDRTKRDLLSPWKLETLRVSLRLTAKQSFQMIPIY